MSTREIAPKLAASLLVLALVSSCGSGAETAATSVAETTTSTTAAPTTTTVAEFVLPTEPSEIADLVLLSDDDIDDGYSFVDTENQDDETCIGVDDPSVKFPPVYEKTVEAEGDHLLMVAAAFYQFEEEAEAVFDYYAASAGLCDGQFVDDTEGEETVVSLWPLGGNSLVESDEFDDYSVAISTDQFTFSAYVEVSRVDNMIFTVSATDPGLTTDMTKRLFKKLEGETDFEPITPTGKLELGPGFTSAEYWSAPVDGPRAVRQIELSGPGAVDWMANVDSARLDELASSSCAAVWQADETTNLDELVVSLFTAEELASTQPTDLGEVFGAGLSVYCPGMLDYFVGLFNTP